MAVEFIQLQNKIEWRRGRSGNVNVIKSCILIFWQMKSPDTIYEISRLQDVSFQAR